MLGPGRLYPYVDYNVGLDITKIGISASTTLNVDMYINNSNEPFSLSSLEGYGYNAGVNLGVVSFNYGTGIDWLGIPTTAQYESLGFGIGPGWGIYGNSSTMQYLIHY